ncbi:hypothetical protein [Klebsiella quasipneumoniae]|nr:hypothetical protein [Klebsiella quasipneumoniae]BDO01178.1 hypothetical protein KAM622c_07650 [Klebsiella quasipneumoniae subsp. quasipneumoniae]
MKLSLDDETYAILREESDRLGMPVPRMIRIMKLSLDDETYAILRETAND